eukprot:Sdes_comp19657_c0_seq8m11481
MADKCPRCDKPVYLAEQVLAIGKKWHRRCFTCKKCNKSLDSTTCTEHEDIYCKTCYSRLFGPKGYGYGLSGAGLQTSVDLKNKTSASSPHSTPIQATNEQNCQEKKSISPQQNLSTFQNLVNQNKSDTLTSMSNNLNQCPRCKKTVYMAEKIAAAGHSWHKGCFRCALCGKTLDSVTVTDRDREIFCKACYAHKFGPKGYGHSGTLQYTE